MPMIEISDATFARLQTRSTPLIDTPDSAISALLDAVDGGSGGGKNLAKKADNRIMCDPDSPPSLRFTLPTRIRIGGKDLQKSECYWNHALTELAQQVGAKHGAKAVGGNIFANHVFAERHDNGFRFLPELGMSIQGQDAVSAWRSINSLAANFDVPVDIEFRWQDTVKAAFPKMKGEINIPSKA